MESCADAENSALIAAAVDRFRSAHEQLSKAMILRSEKWYRDFRGTGSEESYPAYAIEMRDLRRRRWDLSTRLLHELGAVLLPSQREQFGPLLADVLDKIARNIELIERNEHYPPL